ncbi:MAG: tetratricopeptide repeat protein, partial [Flavobacteriales bacterium]|nr:tetratricopeptide repeat protein [Flavobacteriales bacterium]
MTQPQLDATSIEIRLSQARTAIRDGNYADAIALADRILEIEPDHQDAKRLRDDASLQHAKQLVALGMNAYSKESFEEAANLFDEAISYEKHNSGIERLINTERIREFLEESRQKQNLPEDLRLAHIALFAGDHMKALEMISGYQDALVVNFRNKVKQHQEASSALSKNDFVAALPLLEQINKEDPKASIVLENLPRARYHKALEEGIEALDGGDYPSAETKFRGALKHIPGDAKARELLEQARDHRGRREQISKILARAQETISRHHYQEAINLLEQAFKLEPSEKVAGKLSEARNLFNEDRRQQALALVQDGERLTASSELERAQEKFASALQLVSGLKEALLGQEKIKRLLGEREKADSAHRTALNYLEAGDFDGAEKELL